METKKTTGKLVEKIKEINTALPGLWMATVLYGMVCQIIGLFLSIDKVQYSIGLWIGILMAMAMAYHMSYVLFTSIDQGPKRAQALITKHSMIRYLVIVIVLAVIMETRAANPIAAFVGIMGLKAGGYLQPLMIKVTDRFKRSKR